MLSVTLSLSSVAQDKTSPNAQPPVSQSHQDAPQTLANKAVERRFQPDEPHPEWTTIKDIVHDQGNIWTSPRRIRTKDAIWIVPYFGGAAALIEYDRSLVRQLPSSTNTISRANTLSNVGLAGAIGIPAMFYLAGRWKNNPHALETGLLAGEAVVDALPVNLITQRITRRERPNSLTDPQSWWKSGSAFPSDHSMAAWASATVIAEEYPGIATKLLAYGAATGITAARVIAQQHSPSDAFVGAGIGFLMGRYVYHAHHNADLGGADIGTFEKAPKVPKEKTTKSSVGYSDTGNMGSPYVPMDSYVYPLLDRLIGAGYIKTGIAGLRPWTRMEIARLVQESAESIDVNEGGSFYQIYKTLRTEFGPEVNLLEGNSASNHALRLESIYARSTSISGTPLRDSYHFGQTLYNDFGRRYWEGENAYTGFSSYGTYGPLVINFRGEFQHSPAMSAYPAGVGAILANVDETPRAPGVAAGSPTFNNFTLLDSYIGLNFKNIQITAGKDSLWWGPMASGPLLFSDNAEPIYMLRISRVTPWHLPSVFSLLGPMRVEFFFGKMEGHEFPPGPYVHGQKVSFKPTENLEFGFSRAVVFAGQGHPLTMGSFWRSFSSFGDNPSTIPGSSQDVGDRRGGFDFTYRVPKLRDWATLYGDFMVDDDPSPLAAPRRSLLDPGIYFPHIPKIPKLDFRIEAPTSATPAITPHHGDFFYWNQAYNDSYTNNGQILGSWIGRSSKALVFSSTYLFKPLTSLQCSYRDVQLDPDFIQGGGRQKDFRTTLRMPVTSNLSLDSFVQYEVWNMPLLASTVKHDVAVSVQLTYKPRWH